MATKEVVNEATEMDLQNLMVPKFIKKETVGKKKTVVGNTISTVKAGGALGKKENAKIVQTIKTRELGRVARLEVVVLVVREVVALAQERAEFALRLVEVGHRDVGDVHHVDVVELRALEVALHARVGRHDHVVLVLSPVVRALRAEHADDPEGDVVQADRLADGILVGEEVAPHRGTDCADALLIRRAS